MQITRSGIRRTLQLAILREMKMPGADWQGICFHIIGPGGYGYNRSAIRELAVKSFSACAAEFNEKRLGKSLRFSYPKTEKLPALMLSTLLDELTDQAIETAVIAGHIVEP